MFYQAEPFIVWLLIIRDKLGQLIVGHNIYKSCYIYGFGYVVKLHLLVGEEKSCGNFMKPLVFSVGIGRFK